MQVLVAIEQPQNLTDHSHNFVDRAKRNRSGEAVFKTGIKVVQEVNYARLLRGPF